MTQSIEQLDERSREAAQALSALWTELKSVEQKAVIIEALQVIDGLREMVGIGALE